ncbi:P-loop containing nucleoside triphosphate hydrolase protein [Vararia minispora EC-137]|uniref:P-loop containing nucleoside triphosphate hydrolase protein n=1 Tax=Vararia minispora EC-137 TaxID=1314806 RepID=A0ACB8Q8Z4_9AGAM|nr:P-loop containing nucleoside triphosphate hydrolase protein [Vararia minispora EC-137]
MDSSHLFSSPSGRKLVSEILKPVLPFVPHDDQLTCVCKLLDGVDVLAVLPTNAGKTGIFYMFILSIISLHKDPSRYSTLSEKFPSNPVLVVVLPTKGLCDEQKFGIKAVAITEDTVSEARMQDTTSPWMLAQTEASMIMLSPEQLTSAGFAELLEDDTFDRRIAGVAVDEAHLVDRWGRLFRKSFQQIGLIRYRMRRHVVLAAVTGTLQEGGPKKRVCASLGLHDGSFCFLRRSNIRHDVRTQFISLTHGVGGTDFPDLDPILSGGRKCIIFCPTVRRAFDVLVYLWYKAPPFPPHNERIFLYTAVNTARMNTEIRERMRTLPHAQIIIATDALHVGVSIDSIRDVYVLGIDNLDLDKFLQMIGRAGRSKEITDARGILLLPKNAKEKAKRTLDNSTIGQAKKATAQSGKEEDAMDLALARMILADCKTVEQNNIYDNPAPTPCGCTEECTLGKSPNSYMICNCSHCEPPVLPVPIRATRPAAVNPATDRLRDNERQEALEALYKFRYSIWQQLPRTSILPPAAFLPEPTIITILDSWSRLATLEDLSAHISTPYLKELHLLQLFGIRARLAKDFSFRRAACKIRHDDVLKYWHERLLLEELCIPRIAGKLAFEL